DSQPRWQAIAGVEVVSGLSPAAKEARVREWRKSGERVVFVGDGINDASAMAEADAGIAMGSGTDLTQATAHGVLVGNGLGTLPQAVRLSRQVSRSLRGNLLYALVYNVFGMALAAAGLLNPVAAALIMMVSSAWVSWRAAKAAELGLALENSR
ncbi:MAG: HAD-IC family P-type ATPase, partial [Puniceicoccales bacterium]|nr:HAD-IC family P-type ATPase [Puniceicoccales bacterium]